MLEFIMIFISFFIFLTTIYISANKKKNKYHNKNYNYEKYYSTNPKINSYKDALKEEKQKTTFLDNQDKIVDKYQKKYKYKKNIEKGKEYEEYISNIYRNKGYTVWEHGKEKGYKDLGIDVIAKKENQIILIQCKNWNENHRYKIRTKDIKAFRTDGRDFIETYPQFRKYNLELIFMLSGNFIDNGAKKYIAEIQKKNKKVYYQVIENYS